MIISCGDTLMDMLPHTLDTGETAYVPVCGGALFNTAIALGRLGQKTALLTGISTDMFGEQIIKKLMQSNVSIDYCIRTSRPTTMAFVKLVNGNAQYHFVDENSAQRMLDVSHMPLIPNGVQALHFGCLSLTVPPCAVFFETCMAQNALDKIIFFDPNMRPNFITNAIEYRKRLYRCFKHSDIIKMSNEDFAWYTTDIPFTEFSESCIKNGTKLVILTQGDKNVEVVTQNTAFSMAVPPTQVVDTIGAGDTFNAGLLFSLSQQNLLNKDALKHATEYQLKQAIQMGIKVARHTVQKVGATPPWIHEIADDIPK